jgi:hypothetical protein
MIGDRLGPYKIGPHCGREWSGDPAGEIPREASDPVLRPGTHLGPYEITGPLGTGGKGEVEPSCGRERSESPRAKSRALRLRSGQGPRGISC